MLKPSCHRSQVARTSAWIVAAFAGGDGIVASTAANSCWSQACKTVFGHDVTP